MSLSFPVLGQFERGGDFPRIHDPSTVVRDSEAVWTLSTGRGVDLLRREDDDRWRRAARVFPGRDDLPDWHAEQVPANRGHLWAPDIIEIGDQWFVYYSVSSFGSNESAIGLVRGKTLDPDSPEYGWTDEGMVIRSRRSDRFNAIDPAVILDDDRLWMSYGSFWDGIFLVELDAKTGHLKDPDANPERLAMQREIEAPFIHRRGDHYFLFVNWGKCCRGVDSTYEIRVGRSDQITGPYLDRDGVDLEDGGGTLVLGTRGRFIGPGHASIFESEGTEFLVHHYYDRERGGRSDLRMLPVTWEDGWPEVGGAADD